ncbi:hypothetical protein [Streptomyces megasporus]|uniref:hypothetical protein n=1 Tax=Streptomyces megasporus TaxID=44060 RepID=UPI0014700FA2
MSWLPTAVAVVEVHRRRKAGRRSGRVSIVQRRHPERSGLASGRGGACSSPPSTLPSVLLFPVSTAVLVSSYN